MYKNNELWMAKFSEGIEQAKRYVRLCTKLYNHQRGSGNYFLHEHPWLATSWAIVEIEELLKQPDVQRVRTDMCQFGMVNHVGPVGGAVGPVLKPTGFMTNCRHIAKELTKRCGRDHEHIPLVGGPAAAAAIYPHRRCCAICKGLAAQIAEDRGSAIYTPIMSPSAVRSLSLSCQEASGVLPDVVPAWLLNVQVEVDDNNALTGRYRRSRKNGVTKPAGAWPDHWLDPIHEYDGHDVDGSCESRAGEDWLVGELGALYAQHCVEYAVDDVSGAALDPEAVRKGRQVEMDYFSGMRVYDRVPRSEQLETGGPIIGTKWIDINKGDAEHPNIRCRLVGKEFKTTPDDALYACTPPLEALRLVLSRAATVTEDGRHREVMVNDVSRA